jgi:hypothetical protein
MRLFKDERSQEGRMGSASNTSSLYKDPITSKLSIQTSARGSVIVLLEGGGCIG